VRNALAHGESVSESSAEEAQAVLRQALAEILPDCPERLRSAIREMMQSAPGIITPNVRVPDTANTASTHSQTEPPVQPGVLKPSQDSIATAVLPVCDWVYFATPSQEDWATTRAIVSDLGMIIRSVYDNRDPPNAIANVRNIRQGQKILLAYGGKGVPYRAMFSCTVVAPLRPVPGFEAFSFADDAQNERLKKSGYVVDPHLNRFTGISVEISPERLTSPVRKPTGNNTIRSWKEVKAYNARQE
jgi:hypothetical protein